MPPVENPDLAAPYTPTHSVLHAQPQRKTLTCVGLGDCCGFGVPVGERVVLLPAEAVAAAPQDRLHLAPGRRLEHLSREGAPRVWPGWVCSALVFQGVWLGTTSSTSSDFGPVGPANLDPNELGPKPRELTSLHEMSTKPG